jgi:UDPglucose--hexose-1-phosphate uridylyltransferase
VICFSERHDLRLATMTLEQVNSALKFCFEQVAQLDQQPSIGYVQLFENRGQMMGCSNPHPHAQIWATNNLPQELIKELQHQKEYFAKNERPLLMDYLQAELQDQSRLVCANEYAVSLVPFWAVWPFETMLLPRRNISGPANLTNEELLGFSSILRQTLMAYEHHFQAPVPYSMGFHMRPSDGEEHPEWQFHAHIYPPLLRSATIRKHMVGFELLAMPQRDMTAEQSAELLRSACIQEGNE